MVDALLQQGLLVLLATGMLIAAVAILISALFAIMHVFDALSERIRGRRSRV